MCKVIIFNFLILWQNYSGDNKDASLCTSDGNYINHFLSDRAINVTQFVFLAMMRPALVQMKPSIMNVSGTYGVLVFACAYVYIIIIIMHTYRLLVYGSSKMVLFTFWGHMHRFRLL